MKISDLRELSEKDLRDRMDEIYSSLFTVKNKLAYETGANLKEYRALKKELARVKTLLSEMKGKNT